MTEMDLIHIREELRRLTALVEGWDADGITALERDLALEKLRGLYDIVCFAPSGEARSAEVSAEEEMPLSISLDEVLLSIAPEVERVSEPEASVPETEELSAMAAVEFPVPVSEPTQVKPVEQALFGMEEIEQHKRKQRVIMSLYDDAPAASRSAANVLPVAEPSSAPVPEKEPEVTTVAAETPQADPDMTQSPVPAPEFEPAGETEPDSVPETGPDSEIIYAAPAPETTGSVLGEVINRGVQTLGETLAAPRNTISEAAHMAHVDDLRAAIGINDRFLLVRDLFGGDAAACDAAIEKFNSFGDLDDCMIYIAEHYAWNPNSDGAKLLVELLERKLI